MLTTIFYHSDEFFKNFDNDKIGSVTDTASLACINKTYNLQNTLSIPEIITITTYFHYSGYRHFKIYYEKEIKGHLKSAFTKVPSYNRFLEVMQENLAYLMFFSMALNANPTGVAYIDSTPIAVCKNRRISSHKVLKKLAKRGKTSTGWFYGFKLHYVINHRGEIIAFSITPGNISDQDRSVIDAVTKRLFGKLFGDRGYISAELFKDLWDRGIQIITKLRKKMKNILMPLENKLLLRFRGIIESANNILKNCLHLEHSRHRSIKGFFCNLFSAIAAYAFYANKPHVPEAENIDLSMISDF